MTIPINASHKKFEFCFDPMNYDVADYSNFMEETGIFDLLSNQKVHNLQDYVLGIEVGLDSNLRKNRTGDLMRKIVEKELIRSGFKKNKNYLKNMKKSDIQEVWGLDVSSLSNKGKSEMCFDFVVKTPKTIYAIKCNFYSGSGSKLNEAVRSYKSLVREAAAIDGFSFVWITDGKGWKNSKNALSEIFEELPDLYNIQDLKDGALKTLKDEG